MNNKDTKKRISGKDFLPVLLILLLGICVFIGSARAKYVNKNTTDIMQTTSESFYFSANILDDPKMMPVSGATQTVYSFTSDSTSADFTLYGGGEHEINMVVQNFLDQYRYSPKDIDWTYEFTVTPPDGGSSELKAEDIAAAAPDDKLLTGGTQSTNALAVTIPASAVKSYDDNTVVTITIKTGSKSTYSETIKINFTLINSDGTFTYKVIDNSGNPYAELIMMSYVSSADGSPTDVTPVLVWPTDLRIDNSNAMTYTYDGSSFTQVNGMTAHSMSTSQAMSTGESVSIFFFKDNIGNDYSKPVTVVTSSGGQYTVSLFN